MVHTETLKTLQGNLKKKASQKLSVSFLYDLNKHNVYRGIKLYSNHTEINVIDGDVDVGTNATTWVLLISVVHIQ